MLKICGRMCVLMCILSMLSVVPLSPLNVPLAGATYVEGTISVDTTWTIVDSPYIVSNEITINGATLTIDPGVNVKFGGAFSISVRDGMIKARGTTEKPILFTSNKLTPARGDYNTAIHIDAYYDKKASCELSNVIIEYANTGIEIGAIGISNYPNLDQCTIRNSNTGIGLYPTKNDESPRAININKCNIQNNSDGISISTASYTLGDFVNITWNNILNNVNGIVFDGVYGNSNSKVLISNNSILLNSGTGIKDGWNSKRIIEYNGIGYNNKGLVMSGGEIHRNDIYLNSQGAEGKGNAENNYWGDSSGPYHDSLNPTGKGNPVSGVDFIPFATNPIKAINQRPIPVLTGDKLNVALNENVTLSGASSTDDGKVLEFNFDFGDGTETGWVFTSTVKHAYGSKDEYTVKLDVKDDFGIMSNNTATLKIGAGTNSISLTINSPNEGATVNGIVKISGTATSTLGITKVEIKVDDGSWLSADGTTSWEYNWDSTKVPDKSYHNISARGTDGTVYSAISKVKLFVSQPAIIVNITSPSDGMTVNGTVRITGTVSGSTGITSVEIKIDNGDWQSAQGTISWQFDWDTTGVTNKANHNVSVRAYDAMIYSSIRILKLYVLNKVNTIPTVTINAPTSDSTVSGIVTISGASSDIDGNNQIQKVEVMIGSGAWETASGTTSWSYRWDTSTQTSGRCKISVRAYDGTDFSNLVSRNVTVGPPPDTTRPTVSINSLRNGETVNTQSITISGSAADNVAVRNVVITVNGNIVSASLSSNTWSARITLKSGTNSISVTVTDTSGNSNTDYISVNYQNPASTSKPFIPGFELLAILGASIIALLISNNVRKEKNK